MHVAYHAITDLRSARAIIPILKRHDNNLKELVFSNGVYNKIISEIIEENTMAGNIKPGSYGDPIQTIIYGIDIRNKNWFSLPASSP